MATGKLTIADRWREAQAGGKITFDPGGPCTHGHTALRWTANRICVECKRIRDNAYNASHKAEHLARTRRSVASRLQQVREYRKEYYRRNAETAKQRTREWAETNPEWSRRTRREWAQRNREKINAANRERNALNPERSRGHKRKWKQANKHKVREADSKRRALEMGAQVGDRKAYRAFVKWARSTPAIPCYWCGKKTKASPATRHLDHIIPLARGGADAVENLCIACPPCNIRKNAKMPEDFTGQAEFKLA